VLRSAAMAFLWTWLIEAPGYVDRSPLFPNPLVCLRDISQSAAGEVFERLPWNGVETWLRETFDWLYLSWYMDWGLVMQAVGLAVVLIAIRMVLNSLLFKRIPKWVDMNKDGADKLPESLWKVIMYSITWTWAIYLIATENYFVDLKTHWDGWTPGEAVDNSLRWLYIVQIGFYIHCAYATVYLETIRRDFLVMMLHHTLTISLLLFSYTVRFHKIGLLVLFLQDIGDIVLECAKISYYFKERGGREHVVPEYFANVFFAIFTLQHVLFRLYWFPTKVMYSSMHVSVMVFPGGPFYLPFNLMLLALYGMQVYWFKFIVRLLVKILVHGDKVRDTREYEEDKNNKSKKQN
jgi:ceramide synthetase